MQTSLANRNILLIIGGGIAAYKALDLIRRLRERGACLQVILTPAAQTFVTTLAASALAGQHVYTELFSHADGHDINHIRLARAADLILVAPLTASRMAKMVTGLADDLAGATLLAARCPVLLAAAMNPAMWAHAATRRNFVQLKADGMDFIGPEWGNMAEADEAGLGRMSEPGDIVTRVEQMLSSEPAKLLAGRHVLVTSGSTCEPIDPVRYIANRSSGKQGHEIARALAKLGARVTLVSGPVALPDPEGVKIIPVETACAMLREVENALPADAAVFVAAVADWRPAKIQEQKIKKRTEQQQLTVELVRNPDILATIAKGGNRPPLIIGFAAETKDLMENAQEKLNNKGADWIIANDVSIQPGGDSIMGGEWTRVHILSHQGTENWPKMSKREMAMKLAKKIAEKLTQTLQDGDVSVA